MKTLLFTIILLMAVTITAEAQVLIDISKIVAIESDFNPTEIGNAGEIGLCQIGKECLADYNNCHKQEKYREEDLFVPHVNLKIAMWYLEVRLPEILAKHKKPITVKNIIIAYNAGPAYVVKSKRIPQITQHYLERYRKTKSDMERLDGFL